MLNAFDADHRELTLTDLSRRAGLPMSSASRLAGQLLAWGALDRNDAGRYAVGLRLHEIASLSPRAQDLRTIALPYMGDLAEATGQHVLLAVPDGDAALLIERVSRRAAMPVLYRIGGRLPLHATGVGLVILAFGEPELLTRTLSHPLLLEPENQPVPEAQLRRMLAEVRREQVAVLRRQVPTPTLVVAAPIFGPRGRLVAALSLVVPDGRGDRRGLAPALRTAALAVSRELSDAHLPVRTPPPPAR